MRRISRRLWRAVHLSSYVLFWTATFHFILAGTDAPHPLARAGIDVVAAAVVFLTLVRILSPRGHRRADGGADGAQPRRSTRPSHPRRPQPAAGRR
jgi:DMSO/TMAO reductase YedYZ heme-binding membrane subunit